ncbi:Alb1-domain-containing protein [Podospora didyma]|uniref:Alb1-domain-containing protein n=1 Tax=Podospora didyma TaxID=330526 RepID=A0AAE0KLA6_9PEZI|nr:Alb1-domain-containing protein [Podospora didyma]
MAKGGISKPKKGMAQTMSNFLRFKPPNKSPLLGTSLHSRAARRATSPGIDTDKSLKHVKPPVDTTTDVRPAVLAAHHAAGITKKSKKAVLSFKARRRQEKNMDKAEAVMDRTAKKVERSKGQAKVIFSRRRTWDEINKQALNEIPVPSLKKKAVAVPPSKDPLGDAAVAAIYGPIVDDDEEMEVEEGSADVVPTIEAGPPAASTTPPPADDEDVVL